MAIEYSNPTTLFWQGSARAADTYPNEKGINTQLHQLHIHFAYFTKCRMIRCGLIQTRPIGHSIPTFGSWRRAISATSSAWAKKMPDRPKPIKEEEFTEAFLKGSGPGGQKIVSTFVMHQCFTVSNHIYYLYFLCYIAIPNAMDFQTEQNLIRRTVEAYLYRSRIKSASHKIQDAEP